eukprot:194565-Rhodomonas_salina.1
MCCGTGIAYGPMRCSTGMAYGAPISVRHLRYWHSVWRRLIAPCGTDIANGVAKTYGVAQTAVLT